MAIGTKVGSVNSFHTLDDCLHITVVYKGRMVGGKIVELDDVFAMRKEAMKMTGELADKLLQINRPNLI